MEPIPDVGFRVEYHRVHNGLASDNTFRPETHLLLKSVSQVYSVRNDK